MAAVSASCAGITKDRNRDALGSTRFVGYDGTVLMRGFDANGVYQLNGDPAGEAWPRRIAAAAAERTLAPAAQLEAPTKHGASRLASIEALAVRVADLLSRRCAYICLPLPHDHSRRCRGRVARGPTRSGYVAIVGALPPRWAGGAVSKSSVPPRQQCNARGRRQTDDLRCRHRVQKEGAWMTNVSLCAYAWTSNPVLQAVFTFFGNTPNTIARQRPV